MPFPQNLLRAVLALYGLGPKPAPIRRRRPAIEIGHIHQPRRWA